MIQTLQVLEAWIVIKVCNFWAYLNLVSRLSEHICNPQLRKIMKYLILIWGFLTITLHISLLYYLPLLLLAAQYIFSCLLIFPFTQPKAKSFAQAKPLRLEFQIPQVLCKSTKSVRIGARILVAKSFSWNSFTYMYMY